MLLLLLVISIKLYIFSNPPLLKQIQICDATQCSSIYTLWAHNWCGCVYSWWLIQFALLIGSHVWFLSLFYSTFPLSLSHSLFFFAFASTLFSLSLTFSFCRNVIILCSTIVNMIKAKQQHNHLLTILKQLLEASTTIDFLLHDIIV